MSQVFEGTFDAPGEVSGRIFLRPNEEVTFELESASLTGSVVLERTLKGYSAYELIAEFKADGSALSVPSSKYINDTKETFAVRLRCVDLSVGDVEEVAYKLSDVADEFMQTWFAKDGRFVAGFTYEGEVVFKGPVVYPGSLYSKETVVTNDTTPTLIGLDAYNSYLVTSGSEGAEDIAIPDGVSLGQRKLITLIGEGHADDSVDMDYANLSVPGQTISAVAFSDIGDQLLLEWQGTSWVVLAASAGVVTSA